jgi:hypothetical protein
MVAGPESCGCTECGFVCTGKFGGCPQVWERGPKSLNGTLGDQPVRLEARATIDDPAPPSNGGPTTPDDLTALVVQLQADLARVVAEVEDQRRRIDRLVSSSASHDGIQSPALRLQPSGEWLRDEILQRLRERAGLERGPLGAAARGDPPEDP